MFCILYYYFVCISLIFMLKAAPPNYLSQLMVAHSGYMEGSFQKMVITCCMLVYNSYTYIHIYIYMHLYIYIYHILILFCFMCSERLSKGFWIKFGKHFPKPSRNTARNRGDTHSWRHRRDASSAWSYLPRHERHEQHERQEQRDKHERHQGHRRHDRYLILYIEYIT